MYYPLPLLSSTIDIAPLFGPQISGDPHIFDFSSQNPKTLEFDTENFEEFQKMIFDELNGSGCSWGVGRYLEERSSILRNYPQMIHENRIYHAGLDIIVPEGFDLYTPIDAIVFDCGKEQGLGNYGGYVILQHTIEGVTFYSFHGHLDAKHLVIKGEQLSKGTAFARIGSGNDSGGWFTHTHLQIITQKACDENRLFQGYVTAVDLQNIELLFPSPYPLFRFEL